jgi:hypothetical protein
MWHMSTQCHCPCRRGKSVTDAERNSFFVLIPTTRAPSGRKKASSPVPPLVRRLQKQQRPLCIIQTSVGYSQYICIPLNMSVFVRICIHAHVCMNNILNSRPYSQSHLLPEKLFEHGSSYQWSWRNVFEIQGQLHDVSYSNFIFTETQTGT